MPRTDAERRQAQWRRAAEERDRERHARLRAMTDDEAREIAENLLDLVDEMPAKTGGSGLVLQQRLSAVSRGNPLLDPRGWAP